MTRAVVQFRCHDSQKAEWVKAAGGERKLSQWIRDSLDSAADVQEVIKSVHHDLSVEGDVQGSRTVRQGSSPLTAGKGEAGSQKSPPVSPPKPPGRPAKAKAGKTSKSGSCAVTGVPTGLCLCPRCK